MARQSYTQVWPADVLLPRLAAASARLTWAAILPPMLLLFVLIWLGRTSGAASAQGVIWYVAPGGAGTSCTQAAPCGNIQVVADLASDGDEIRVAQGTYTDWNTRSVGSDVVTQTVFLSKSLTLRGGYAYTSSTDYDWTTSLPLIRSAILDAQGKGRVIYIANNVAATVEGLTVTNGSSDQGGGIYIAGGNSVIQNSAVYSNVASLSGGGIYIAGGSPTVRGNEIYTNTATDGGGIYVVGGSPTILNNQIHGNRATGSGGDYGGGGIHVRGDSTIIRGNGIYANSANSSSSGGGVYVWATGVLIDQNTIHHNSGAYRGGGIYVRENAIPIRNNLIYGNSASDNGGGISYFWATGVVENNTIYGNTGDGIYHDNQGFPVIRNNIVVSNSTYGIRGSGSLTINYNDAFGNGNATNYSGVILGTGNVTETPQFESDGVDFHLKAISLLIDQADPSNPPSNDYDGFARPFGSSPDMGAYEYHTGDCFARLNSGQVYTTVQAAVNAASLPTDTVKVAGVCTGVQTFVDGDALTQTVYLSRALTLRGGYSETSWISPTTLTVLDAQGQGRVVYITGTFAITVDGFVIRGGDATNAGNGTRGGGLYIAGAYSPTLQNLIVYSNTAAEGGGLAAEAGGSPRLLNNTFVSNTAISGGGLALYGPAAVSNTIVVSNAGGGIYIAGDITPSLDYNDVWSNADGDYVMTSTSVTTGAHSISVDPRFVNFAGGDLHLRYDSPLFRAADPNTTLAWDVEGDSRLLGWAPDIGADQVALYPNATFSAVQNPPQQGLFGHNLVFTHTLINDGTLLSDTFRLTPTLTINNYSGPTATWRVACDTQPIALMRNEGRQVTVTVYVGEGISGTFAIVGLRAESQSNPNAFAETSGDQVDINQEPGISLTPVMVTQRINPGTVVTFAHTLRNTGGLSDTITFASTHSPGWQGITILAPTQPITLGPFGATTIWVSASVTSTLPGGEVETVFVTASSTASDTLHVALTDTVEVNFVPGDRYVSSASVGNDTLNNCLVKTSPCRTIAYAVGQVANDDTINVAAGVYTETEITLNKDLTLRGGHSPNFSVWNPEAYITIIDAQKKGRVLNIFGSPTVEGFTLQNGATDGSGGGVYISLGSPILRRNVIISNTAGSYGGGIYNNNLFGTPRLERNVVAFNTAEWGGGFASSAHTPEFWNNLVYKNTANASGGGVYVDAGNPLVWHDTIYSNTASSAGGGIYLGGGSPVVSNTIVAGNSAVNAGGIFSQTGTATLAYNDVVSNTNGEYAGVSGEPAHSFSVGPLFVNVAAYDLRLQIGSPLIDQGDFGPVNQDYWGNPRPAGAGPDIGAYEWVFALPALAPNNARSGLPGQMLEFTHVLTNSGNYTDTFTLMFQSSQGWPVSVAPAISVTLGIGASSPITVNVTIPSSAISGTVDTTVVTVTSHLSSSVQAAAVNMTTVGRVVTVSLQSDLAALGSQGQTVVYTHTLRNGGNYTDTFDLVTGNSEGWTVTLPASVTLQAGESKLLAVGVAVPTDVFTTSVIMNLSVITATSRVSPTTAWAVVSDTTYVNRAFGVEFASDLAEIGLPGQVVTFSHTLTNTGTDADTFTFATQGGWSPAITPSPATLGRGEARTVTITFQVPPGTISGTVNATIITATSTSAAQFGLTRQADVKDTTTVGASPGVAVSKIWSSPVTEGWCVSLSDEPEDVTYAFQLANTGNLTDTFEITATSSNGFTVTVTPISYTGVLPGAGPASQRSFTVTVHAPPTITQFIDVLSATVRSATDPYPSGSAVFTTTANWVTGLGWNPITNTGVVSVETSVLYYHTLTNTGKETATVQLTGVSDHGWAVVLNPATVSDMPASATAGIQVTVSVPFNDYTINVTDTVAVSATATSTTTFGTHCQAGAGAWDVTRVTRPRVKLSDGADRSAPPGTAVVYTHLVSNTGAITDTYGITLADTLGWAVSITPTSVSLVPSSGALVTATVNVPLTGAQSLSGTLDTLFITATSSLTSAVFSAATDRTTVSYAPSAVLAPDQSDGANPGGVVTYTHALTNTGNNTETFKLTTIGGFGYAVVSPTASVVLGPGQVYTGITIWVYIPGSAASWTTERTQVTAKFGDQQAVAVDLTTVIPLPAPRYVAPNGKDPSNNCNSKDSPCATVQKAVDEAAIGDEIHVAAGSYTDPLVRSGGTQTVYINKNVTLLGGHSTTNWLTRNPVQRPTILDAQGLGRVIVITGSVTVTVDGFRIVGGTADDGDGDGGGINVGASGPVTLSANLIYSNTATHEGGAVYARSADLRLYNNVLYTNTADLGGGVYVYTGTTVTLINDTLVANRAITGGALYQAGGWLAVTNTIFVSNTAVMSGGVVYTEPGASSVFAYNNLWGNDNSENLTSANSFSANPLFQNVASGDFHLTGYSPLIDQGAPVSLTVDWEDDARPQLRGYDIGADELAWRRAWEFAPSSVSLRSISPTVYSRVLSNTGSYTDTAILTATIDLPDWTVQVTPSSAIMVGPGLTTTVQVSVTMPDTTAIGTASLAVITATSIQSPTQFGGQATDTIIFQSESDVRIDKSVSPAGWLGHNSPITYTLAYLNAGPGVAQDVVITDVIPAALTNVTYTVSGPSITATDGITYEWHVVGPLSAGQGGTITVTGLVSQSPGLVASLVNTASVASLAYDITPTNNIASVVNEVDTQPPGTPTLVSPVSDTITTTRDIVFAWNAPGDSGSGVQGYQVTLTGTLYYTYPTDYAAYYTSPVVYSPTTHLTLTQMADGVYTWTVKAFDQVGNAGAVAASRALTVGIPILRVAKQATPILPVAGAPFTYALTVSNTGVIAATGVVVTDAVPPGATYITGGVQSGNVVTWSNLMVSLGSSAQVTFSVSACQVVSNTSYRVAGSAQGVSSTMGAVVATAFAAPTIGLTFTQSVTEVGVYQPVYVTGTVETDGSQGMAWQWNFGDGHIGAGSAISHEYHTGGSFVATLMVTDTCGFTQSASSVVAVFAPQVAMRKSGPAQAQAGEPLTYTLLVTNTSRYNELTHVVVTDTLPDFISGGHATPPASTAITANGTITWSLAPIPLGESSSITLVVTATRPLTNGTLITNAAQASADYGASDSSSASTTVQATPNLTIAQSAPALTQPGMSLTYTIRYTNTGSGNALGVVVTDVLPSNISGGYAIPMPTSGAILAGQVITWERPVVPGDGGADWVRLVVTVSSPLNNGTLLTNTAGIRCEGASAATGPVTATVISAPRLEIGKSSAPVGYVSAGERITYTLRITNTGMEDAHGVIVSDTTPLSTTFVDAGYILPAAGGILSPTLGGSGRVVWQLSTFIPALGGSAAVTFAVQVASPLNNGTLIVNPVYTATAIHAGVPVTGSSVMNTVTAAPNLKITQSAPAWVQANTPLTYTIRYTNTGNGNASGVVVTDTLPSNVSGGYAIPMPASGAILAGQVITWSRPDVPGLGGTGSITLIVTPTRSLVTGTMLLNTAGITCSEGVSASVGPVTTTVVHGPATTVALSPVSRVVTAGESITYTVAATDTAGNVWDATNAAAFGISSGADGSWAGNVYTSRVAGTWTVTATVDGVPGMASLVVNLTALLHVELTAAPAWQIVGHSSALTATVTDLLGNPVANGTRVVFTTDLGEVVSPGTTANGVATSTISATQAGVAHVLASYGGVAASAVVTFTPDAPYTVTVSASPQVITPTGTSTVKAIVTDRYRNAVAEGTPITFTWTLGVLSPSTTGTVGGQALATFTSATEGAAIITATAGFGVQGGVTITVKSDTFYVYLPLVIRLR